MEKESCYQQKINALDRCFNTMKKAPEKSEAYHSVFTEISSLLLPCCRY